MTNLAKLNVLKTVVTVSCAATLALGISGCSNEKRNKMFNRNGSFSSAYGQRDILNNAGLTGTNWDNFGQNNGQQTTTGDGAGTQTNTGTDERYQKGGKGTGTGADQAACQKTGTCGKSGDPATDYRNTDAYKNARAAKQGELDAVKQKTAEKTDSDLRSMDAEIERLNKILNTEILTTKIPAWSVDCDADGDSKMGDDISDKCKEKHGLDVDSFYGYRVQGRKISGEEMKKYLDGKKTKKGFASWVSKAWKNAGDFLSGNSGFNRDLAEVIAGISDDPANVGKSSLEILKGMKGVSSGIFADISKCPDHLGVNANQSQDPTTCSKDYAWIKGGYDEPVLFNPTDEWEGSFNAASLTGIGSNVGTLGDGDKFLYIAEGFVRMTRDREIRLASLISGLSGDVQRRAGGFFVFVNGNLEVTNLSLGEKVTRMKGKLNKVNSGACPDLVTLAVIFEEDKGNAEIPIRENLVMRAAADSDTYELLPQEISTVVQPGNCPRYQAELIEP